MQLQAVPHVRTITSPALQLLPTKLCPVTGLLLSSGITMAGHCLPQTTDAPTALEQEARLASQLLVLQFKPVSDLLDFILPTMLELLSLFTNDRPRNFWRSRFSSAFDEPY